MAKKNLGNAELVSSIGDDDTIFVETGGSVRRAPVSAIPSPSLEEQEAYGIERAKDDSSTYWTRIGNLSLHKTLPIQSLMRGCLLNDDGTVKEYLPVNSWVDAVTDGTRGQVMVEVPTHYVNFTEDDTTIRAMFSLYPLAGYTKIPKFYFGAYEATVERSTNKLCSVKNDGEDYRGGNNDADRDGTYRSQLGVPATSISMTNFRTYARNRGSYGKDGCGWNVHPYYLYKALVWLYLLEYADNNVQRAFNAELTSEGYHQGGLGSGVTDLDYSAWWTFNGRYPFIPCGYTDELGNGTGYVPFEMPEEYGTLTTNVPRWRGIENFFGHITKWQDGLLVEVNPEEESGGSGLSRVFACNEPAKFSSSNFDNYYLIGNEPRVETYITQIHFGVTGEIHPSEADGGSTSTYYPDQITGSSVSVSSTTTRGVLCGGNASYGSNAGMFAVNSSYAHSSSGTHRGSRLCFIPEDE